MTRSIARRISAIQPTGSALAHHQHTLCARVGRVGFPPSASIKCRWASPTSRPVKGVWGYSSKNHHSLKDKIRHPQSEDLPYNTTHFDRFEYFTGFPGVQPCRFYPFQEGFVVQGTFHVVCAGGPVLWIHHQSWKGYSLIN